MNEDKKKVMQNITVSLNEFRLPLNVPREEESIYRQAASMYNERIEYYKQKFNSDNADFQAIVAFEMAVEYCKLEHQKNPDIVHDTLSSLSQKIEESLKNE